jgi:hypothetical protein
MIKRFDRLDVVTSDLADAGVTYNRNFGFSIQHAAGGDDATITLGDAEIRLRSGWDAAQQIAKSGEGLGAVWLEADDIREIVEALEKARIGHRLVDADGGRRAVEIEPAGANMVPLFIFDRRGH